MRPTGMGIKMTDRREYTEAEWHAEWHFAESVAMAQMVRDYPDTNLVPQRWPIMNAVVVFVGTLPYEFYLATLIEPSFRLSGNLRRELARGWGNSL